MGLTVEQVLERALEEIFEAGGTSRPAWDVLHGAIDADDTAIVLKGRQGYVPPDGTLEFWDSSMEVSDIYTSSGVNITLQTRGYLGTTAATHSDGVKVVLDNPYPRYVLLNGLKAVIGQLYGFGLYDRESSADTITNTPVSLPTGGRDVVGHVVWAYDGSQYHPLRKGRDWTLITAFTPPKIQFHPSFWFGRSIQYDYKKDFDTSTFALTTDLETTVGLPSTLTPHLALGLAGHILSGRDVPSLESEHIRPDPQNPQQPGTRASIGQLLWSRFIQGPVTAERMRQLEHSPTTITTGGF